MQCKGQGYMVLKDTTCKDHWKLILPLKMFPCGIMDLRIEILEFKNYLLARMQYKGQGYMVLKDTTCKDHWKLILPLQMSPCGIMDLSLAFGPTNSPHYID